MTKHTLRKTRYYTSRDMMKATVTCEYGQYVSTHTIYCVWDGWNYSGNCAHCKYDYTIPEGVDAPYEEVP